MQNTVAVECEIKNDRVACRRFALTLDPKLPELNVLERVGAP